MKRRIGMLLIFALILLSQIWILWIIAGTWGQEWLDGLFSVNLDSSQLKDFLFMALYFPPMALLGRHLSGVKNRTFMIHRIDVRRIILTNSLIHFVLITLNFLILGGVLLIFGRPIPENLIAMILATLTIVTVSETIFLLVREPRYLLVQFAVFVISYYLSSFNILTIYPIEGHSGITLILIPMAILLIALMGQRTLLRQIDYVRSDY